MSTIDPKDIENFVEEMCNKYRDDFIKFNYSFELFVGYFSQWLEEDEMPMNKLRAEWDKLQNK